MAFLQPFSFKIFDIYFLPYQNSTFIKSALETDLI